MISDSGPGDFDSEVATDSPERLLHLAHVRPVVGVGELSSGRLAHAEPSGKLNLSDSLGLHSRIQRQFGGNDGREGEVPGCLPITRNGPIVAP